MAGAADLKFALPGSSSYGSCGCAAFVSCISTLDGCTGDGGSAGVTGSPAPGCLRCFRLKQYQAHRLASRQRQTTPPTTAPAMMAAVCCPPPPSLPAAAAEELKDVENGEEVRTPGTEEPKLRELEGELTDPADDEKEDEAEAEEEEDDDEEFCALAWLGIMGLGSGTTDTLRPWKVKLSWLCTMKPASRLSVVSMTGSEKAEVGGLGKHGGYSVAMALSAATTVQFRRKAACCSMACCCLCTAAAVSLLTVALRLSRVMLRPLTSSEMKAALLLTGVKGVRAVDRWPGWKDRAGLGGLTVPVLTKPLVKPLAAPLPSPVAWARLSSSVVTAQASSNCA